MKMDYCGSKKTTESVETVNHVWPTWIYSIYWAHSGLWLYLELFVSLWAFPYLQQKKTFKLFGKINILHCVHFFHMISCPPASCF